MFMDSDDELVPDALETLLEIADIDQSDVVRGSHMLINRSGNLEINVFEQFHQPEVSGIRYRDCPSLVQLYSSWNMLISRNLIRRNGLRFRPDLRIGEDRFFNQMLFNSANKISMSKHTTYHWSRMRPDEDHLSMTTDPEIRFASILAYCSLVSSLEFSTQRHMEIARVSMVFEVLHCLQLAIKHNKPDKFVETLKTWIKSQGLTQKDLLDKTVKGWKPDAAEMLRNNFIS